MSFSLTRLTLYGLISSIDADLRNLVVDHVVQGRDVEKVISNEQLQKLKQRAEKDGATDSSEYYDYLDFGDTLPLLRGHKENLPDGLNKFIKNNYQALNELIPIRNRVMHSRPVKFNDLACTDETSKKILLHGEVYFPHLSSFVKTTTENPEYVFSLDVTELHNNQENQHHNLPIPDFDETGFIGRDTEFKSLLAACKSHWPIITVLGEGGFGKTALALRAAYELLDDTSADFDAIVWVTSKTTRLSLNDIETIDGAIQTSLGIFQEISKELGGTITVDKSIEEVISYLNEFKILLIIDNLETVLDQKIKDFFTKLNGKSKILITSRVGTGEMNYPFHLSGLSEGDAIQLLRATAKVRRVNGLVQTNNQKLSEYCRKMKYNPGFIKWFVSSVQCGKRPEQVLNEPKVFLDFCLSNVYDYISDDAKIVVDSMVSVPGDHAQPFLSYLTGLEGDVFQKALRDLWSANMVVMSNTHTSTGYETVYRLGDLPRLYVLKNHPPSPETMNNFRQKKRQIMNLHDEMESNKKLCIYEPSVVSRRTFDDTVIAKYLTDAMKLCRKRKNAQALEIVEKAKALDPSFYEVYRVEAWVQRWLENYPATMDSYETAISSEPNSSPLRFWYGGFLLRDMQDAAAAVEQFILADKIDNKSVQIKTELGRALLYQGEYQKADKSISDALELEVTSVKMKRKIYDVWCQVSLRLTQKAIDSGEYLDALASSKRLLEKYRSMKGRFVDDKIIETVKKIIYPLEVLELQLSHSELLEEVKASLIEARKIRYKKPFQKDPKIEHLSANEVKMNGVIKSFLNDKRFGFVIGNDGHEYFFHESDIDSTYSGKDMIEGVSVDFTIGANHQGPVAKNIYILD